MIIDEMITDRTQADVEEVYALKAMFQIVDSVGTYILITAVNDKYLVFTGTQEQLDKYMGGLKGCVNYTDLNRIGNAIRYLRIWFNTLGIYPNLVGKNDWSINIDHVEQSDATNLITDLQTIKALTEVDVPLPQNMNGWTFETMNNVERLIVESYNELTRRHAEYVHSGTSYSGIIDGVIA